MLRPQATHAINVEQAAARDLGCREQILCPGTKRPAQPAGERNGKPALRTLDHFPRYVTVQQVAQRLLASAVVDLAALRDAPGEFKHPMVQERCARLEADCHRRAINLDENIVRHVADGVEEHA